jgi:purine nucleosidase
MQRLIIDTDTGSDDAVALVMALKWPDTLIEAITVVAGNVPLAQGVQNALYTVELCGRTVPVYAGRDRPLLRPLATAENVHGGDGMGDMGLPLAGRTPTPGHAVDVLRETINRNPGEITLVTLGPLSNVAIALLRDPGLAHKVKQCVIMGGTSDNWGNMGLVGEFNIWVDPEAAKIVFESEMPITMVGWDIARKYAVLDGQEVAALRQLNTPLAHFCVDIQAALLAYAQQQSGLAGFDLADPIAMAVALDEEVITASERYFVTVETSAGVSRGQTILDYRNRLGRDANTRVVLAANHHRFLQMLQQAVT